jgi:vacuolar protein-sorting-associated protein 4
MGNQEFLNRAISTVQKAIEHDNALEYEKAYEQYCNAREFIYALSFRGC